MKTRKWKDLKRKAFTKRQLEKIDGDANGMKMTCLSLGFALESARTGKLFKAFLSWGTPDGFILLVRAKRPIVAFQQICGCGFSYVQPKCPTSYVPKVAEKIRRERANRRSS